METVTKPTVLPTGTGVPNVPPTNYPTDIPIAGAGSVGASVAAAAFAGVVALLFA